MGTVVWLIGGIAASIVIGLFLLRFGFRFWLKRKIGKHLGLWQYLPDTKLARISFSVDEELTFSSEFEQGFAQWEALGFSTIGQRYSDVHLSLRIALKGNVALLISENLE